MGKSKKITIEQQVAEYYLKLSHPLASVVEALRRAVLSSGNEIEEQIKWNSPAFFYTGEMKPYDPKEYKRDIVVFNLHKKDYILLVFPTGSIIHDPTGLLKGDFTDGRKIAQILSLEDLKQKEKDLQTIIKEWLKSATSLS